MPKPGACQTPRANSPLMTPWLRPPSAPATRSGRRCWSAGSWGCDRGVKQVGLDTIGQPIGPMHLIEPCGTADHALLEDGDAIFIHGIDVKPLTLDGIGLTSQDHLRHDTRLRLELHGDRHVGALEVGHKGATKERADRQRRWTCRRAPLADRAMMFGQHQLAGNVGGRREGRPRWRHWSSDRRVHLCALDIGGAGQMIGIGQLDRGGKGRGIPAASIDPGQTSDRESRQAGH